MNIEFPFNSYSMYILILRLKGSYLSIYNVRFPPPRRLLMQFSFYGLGNFRTQGAAINHLLLNFNISELHLHDKEKLSKMCVWFTVSGTKELYSAVANL